MIDEMLGEALTPPRVDYAVAQRAWETWFDAHSLPANAALDARLRDAESRAGFVPVCRSRGYFLIPTIEFVAALVALLRRLPGPYVEVGAGQGALARAVRAVGIPLTATDNGAWWPNALPHDVVKVDIHAALAQHAPATVLAVWPPRATDWPAVLRRSPSIRAYVVIGDGTGHLTGSAATWASAPGWRRLWLSRLARAGRCRLDADGVLHTRALLVRRRAF